MITADEIESDLQAAKRLFMEYPKTLHTARDELRNIHCEMSDIEHVFEFGNINGPDTMKISKEYKELRRKRREIKNEIERLEAIESLKDNIASGKIADAIGKIRKLNNTQQNRMYGLKVRKDLEKYMVR